MCSAEADYDVGGDSARNPAQRIAVSSQSLLARAPDTITHREQRSTQPRHVGTATAHALEEVAQKWRALAERRCAYFLELHRSGRWRHYYSEEQFLVRLREAIELSERWVEIAASPTAAVVSEHAHPVADIATRSAA